MESFLWYLAIGSVIGGVLVYFIRKGIYGEIPPEEECKRKNPFTRVLLDVGKGAAEKLGPLGRIKFQMSEPVSSALVLVSCTLTWPAIVICFVLLVIINALLKVLDNWSHALERKIADKEKKKTAES